MGVYCKAQQLPDWACGSDSLLLPLRVGSGHLCCLHLFQDLLHFLSTGWFSFFFAYSNSRLVLPSPGSGDSFPSNLLEVGGWRAVVYRRKCWNGHDVVCRDIAQNHIILKPKGVMILGHWVCGILLIRRDEPAEASPSCLALSGVLKAENGFYPVAVVISRSHRKSASLCGQKLGLLCGCL